MIADIENLPEQWPTHRHSAEFWEYLGRAVATFSFLEEVLGKAILSFEGNRSITENEYEEEKENFQKKLEKAAYDTLNPLIKSYMESAKKHCDSNGPITEICINDLTEKLREVATHRNVLCHGSWRTPDEQGRSTPFFVNKKLEVFDTPIDVNFLKQTQEHTAELAYKVIETVTAMGWEFPGMSKGSHQNHT